MTDTLREAFEAWQKKWIPDYFETHRRLLWCAWATAWQARDTEVAELQERVRQLEEGLREIIASDEVHEVWFHAIAKEALAKEKDQP